MSFAKTNTSVLVPCPTEGLVPMALVESKPTTVVTLPTVIQFILICLQLALILLVVRWLHIEEQRPFFSLMGLAAAGFVIHAWLPLRLRLPFFTVLSLSGILLLLGWPDGLWVLGLGGLLIGICRLPVPWAVRVLLLAAVAAFLAVGRLGSPAPFWPVLGSMFMFRLMVYLQETRLEPQPPLLTSLAYFFPLPNVCFPLFPVLDFQTFRSTYYNQEAYTLYQSGVGWIVRGLSHLLLYRAIKYYLLPAPQDLHDLPHVLLFVAANYALYMRISGWFHIITGTLHLFGFNLPRTHQNYFLATSCTDIWRRINTYWKEFMANMFFFPVFFALRGWSKRLALVAAGLSVFLATWLLHVYQTFWLRGELPLRAGEAALWFTAGILAIVNLQLDFQRPHQIGVMSDRRGTVGGALRWSLQVLGMFSLISLFWAWWSIPNFGTYVAGAVHLSSGRGISDIWKIMAVLTALLSAGILSQLLWHRWLADRFIWGHISFTGSAAIHTATLLVLAAIGLPLMGDLLGSQTADVLATLRLDTPTLLETQQAVQGYYEELADANISANPWAAPNSPPSTRQDGATYHAISRPVDDWQGRELIPGWSGEILGSKTTFNRFGLRGQPGLTRAKPTGTRRIALIGSSVVMGYGVKDEEVFAHLLQEWLNTVPRTLSGHYEALNFGTGLSHALHRRVLIDRKVWSFEPDALYYFAHQDEILGTVKHLAQLLATGKKLPYPYLDEIVQQAGITSKTSPGLSEVQLQPFAHALLNHIYTSIAADCRARDIVPVWIYLPMPGVAQTSLRSLNLDQLVKQTGFEVVNLSTWAEGYAPKDVLISAQSLDYHPNALGHRVIAEQIEAQLRQRPELLPR